MRKLIRWLRVDLDEYDARLRGMTSQELAAEGRRLRRERRLSAFVLALCAAVLIAIAVVG